MDSALRKWFDRLTELQNMIDREAEAARSGCVRSQQIIIDAEREQEQLQQLSSPSLRLARSITQQHGV